MYPTLDCTGVDTVEYVTEERFIERSTPDITETFDRLQEMYSSDLNFNHTLNESKYHKLKRRYYASLT